MHAEDVLYWGHVGLMDSLKEFDQTQWNAGGVCGWWSVKHILAHLSSYELVLGDVLASFVDDSPIPHLEAKRSRPTQ